MGQGCKKRVFVHQRLRAGPEELEHLTGAFDRVNDWAALNDWPYCMKVVFETGGNPEVSAATADGPEQIWLLLIAGPQNLAISGDEFDGPQIIQCQAALAHQPAQS